MNLIKSIGHGFAIAFHDITTFFQGVATKAPAIAQAAETDLATLAPFANTLFAGVAPQFLPAARGAEAILGEVFGAIHDAGAEATTAGVVVKIEADLVNGVKDLVALLKGHPAVQSAIAATTPASSSTQ